MAADDLAGRDHDVLGQTADAELQLDAGSIPGTQRDPLHGYGKTIARRRHFVIAGHEIGNRERSVGADVNAAFEAGRWPAHGDRCERQDRAALIDDLTHERRRPDLGGRREREEEPSREQ